MSPAPLQDTGYRSQLCTKLSPSVASISQSHKLAQAFMSPLWWQGPYSTSVTPMVPTPRLLPVSGVLTFASPCLLFGCIHQGPRAKAQPTGWVAQGILCSVFVIMYFTCGIKSSVVCSVEHLIHIKTNKQKTNFKLLLLYFKKPNSSVSLLWSNFPSLWDLAHRNIFFKCSFIPLFSSVVS